MKKIHLKAKPEPISFELNKAAVIVVDMQNAFAKKGGMLDVLGRDISGADSVIENTGKVLHAARQAGIPIIYLKMSYNPDLSNCGTPQSPHWHKEKALVAMRQDPDHSGRFLIQGTWDEQIVDELRPETNDLVLLKSRYSGFRGTNLDSVLKRDHITHLVFTGISTNICVESTLRDAFFMDYWPILITDAVNNTGPQWTQKATIWAVENALGWVASTEDMVRALTVNSEKRAE